MSNLNCPNCGAVIEPEHNKCQYCGTSYFDLTSIDFESCKPVWLKMRTPFGVITAKVIPSLDSIEFTSEPTYVYGGRGNKLFSLEARRTFTPSINFRGVPFDYNNHDTLFILEEKA